MSSDNHTRLLSSDVETRTINDVAQIIGYDTEPDWSGSAKQEGILSQAENDAFEAKEFFVVWPPGSRTRKFTLVRVRKMRLNEDRAESVLRLSCSTYVDLLPKLEIVPLLGRD